MMIRRFHVLPAILSCVALIACAPADEPVPPEASPPETARVCPAGPYLNCMPIVPPERQQYCSANYRDWIAENCPNVEIVY